LGEVREIVWLRKRFMQDRLCSCKLQTLSTQLLVHGDLPWTDGPCNDTWIPSLGEMTN
jgi:hypothetical protein